MRSNADPLDSANADVRALWERASEALERADNSAARGLLAEAQERAFGDQELDDRLYCGVAALDLELGRDVSGEELRAILMRSSSPVVLHLAAYQLARRFELQEQPKKMLFYARCSLNHALDSGEDHLVARSQNMVGNALVAGSYFEEARSAYETALALASEPESIRHLALLQNVGYCRTVQDELPEGLGLLYRAVRGFRSRNADAYEALARVDLAFGLLLAGRPQLARRHADRAVRLAGEPSSHSGRAERKALINALFLQAEAAAQCDDVFGTRRACARLSEATGEPDLSEYVLQADVLELVNLRA